MPGIRKHLLQAIFSTSVHVRKDSLALQMFTTEFKQAQTTPLHRNASLDAAQVQNYQSVSLFPFLFRCMKSGFEQLSGSPWSTSFLDQDQLDFKSSHSAQKALLYVIEALRAARGETQPLVLILQELISNHCNPLYICTWEVIHGVHQLNPNLNPQCSPTSY